MALESSFFLSTTCPTGEDNGWWEGEQSPRATFAKRTFLPFLRFFKRVSSKEKLELVLIGQGRIEIFLYEIYPHGISRKGSGTPGLANVKQ